MIKLYWDFGTSGNKFVQLTTGQSAVVQKSINANPGLLTKNST